MDEVVTTARRLLHRHPAPAVPADELHALVVRERPGCCPSLGALIQVLSREAKEVRLLEGDEKRFAAAGRRRWVLPSSPGRPAPRLVPRSLEARMRESLRSLGSALEPGSNLALARWARLLAEERRVRRALRRRLRQAG